MIYFKFIFLGIFFSNLTSISAADEEWEGGAFRRHSHRKNSHAIPGERASKRKSRHKQHEGYSENEWEVGERSSRKRRHDDENELSEPARKKREKQPQDHFSFAKKIKKKLEQDIDNDQLERYASKYLKSIPEGSQDLLDSMIIERFISKYAERQDIKEVSSFVEDLMEKEVYFGCFHLANKYKQGTFDQMFGREETFALAIKYFSYTREGEVFERRSKELMAESYEERGDFLAGHATYNIGDEIYFWEKAYPDYEEARKLGRDVKEKLARTSYLIGEKYFKTLGTTEVAKEWLLKSITFGSLEAGPRLGEVYCAEADGFHYTSKKIELLKKAAEYNVPRALYRLGDLYHQEGRFSSLDIDGVEENTSDYWLGRYLVHPEAAEEYKMRARLMLAENYLETGAYGEEGVKFLEVVLTSAFPEVVEQARFVQQDHGIQLRQGAEFSADPENIHHPRAIDALYLGIKYLKEHYQPIEGLSDEGLIREIKELTDQKEADFMKSSYIKEVLDLIFVDKTTESNSGLTTLQVLHLAWSKISSEESDEIKEQLKKRLIEELYDSHELSNEVNCQTGRTSHLVQVFNGYDEHLSINIVSLSEMLQFRFAALRKEAESRMSEEVRRILKIEDREREEAEELSVKTFIDEVKAFVREALVDDFVSRGRITLEDLEVKWIAHIDY